ncbi:MAG: beta-galactosidase [Pseudomonadota bacterium]
MFGVCYYPEHWPEHLWEPDAQAMAALGLRVVRIGEFAWSRLEPSPGEFAFDWLDKAISTLAGAGLSIVMCTPTATPPKWLIDTFPSILPADPKTGRTRGFGSRRHYDFSSADYRRECERITSLLAERYGHRPEIIGWQTDNEIGCHDTTLSVSPDAVAAFRDWCRRRYGSIDRLNQAWGNVFWSMEYASFAEIESPYGAVTETNPAHQLAFRRFASDQVVDFHRETVAALRERSNEQFVTHNFIPMSDTAVDNQALAAPLDFPSYDSYPLGRLDELLHDRLPIETFQRYQRTGHPDLTAFILDQTRGLGDGPFWIMEQQPGPVNWASANPAPAPGAVRLWTYEAFAHGAECVSYFRWRQAPFAQEQMHAGLRRPDGAPAQRWDEIARCINEITALDVTNQSTARARVAIVTDPISDWVTEIERQSADYDVYTAQFEHYRALRSLGLDVDVIDRDADLDGYALVVAPCLAVLSEAFVARARACGAVFVFGPRTGSKTAEFRIPDHLPPGPLAQWLDLTVVEVDTLRPESSFAFEWHGTTFLGSLWRDRVDVDGEFVLARYDDGDAAVVRNGAALYLTTLCEHRFLVRLYHDLCGELGVDTHLLAEDLRLRRRGELTFAFNFGDRPLTLPLESDTELLCGEHTLAPRDVAVWREQGPSVAQQREKQ